MNLRNMTGKTPCDVARRFGNRNCVKILGGNPGRIFWLLICIFSFREFHMIHNNKGKLLLRNLTIKKEKIILQFKFPFLKIFILMYFCIVTSKRKKMEKKCMNLVFL